ncbi:hypothetical protein L484_024699 [Morus notabilis]|uniref:Cullin neddylation domain-containing protein n=1 Tax=Morus notabilis TaxID=981085 RepID=W9RT79_9ROSA|nr:hypothetical protein L484_024699 [Morus notabilis]
MAYLLKNVVNVLVEMETRELENYKQDFEAVMDTIQVIIAGKGGFGISSFCLAMIRSRISQERLSFTVKYTNDSLNRSRKCCVTNGRTLLVQLNAEDGASISLVMKIIELHDTRYRCRDNADYEEQEIFGVSAAGDRVRWLLSPVFKPDIKLIKKRIEDLITREYLERQIDYPNTFMYIA